MGEARVVVELYLGERKERREERLPAGTTVAELLARLGLGGERREALSVLVNGRYAPPDRPLADGDEVALFPQVVGGGRP